MIKADKIYIYRLFLVKVDSINMLKIYRLILLWYSLYINIVNCLNISMVSFLKIRFETDNRILPLQNISKA